MIAPDTRNTSAVHVEKHFSTDWQNTVLYKNQTLISSLSFAFVMVGDDLQHLSGLQAQQ